MLMVSGIGPREKLQSLGIDVLSDRPGVGQNLYVSKCANLFTINRHELNSRAFA